MDAFQITLAISEQNTKFTYICKQNGKIRRFELQVYSSSVLTDSYTAIADALLVYKYYYYHG